MLCAGWEVLYMRLLHVTRGDIRFQWKHGFYLLYAVFTAMYVFTALAFPPALRSNAAAVLIFTDPAAIGLFFMGALVLLEQSQNVLHALAVSPVRPAEYMAAKIASLTLIGTAVGALIAGLSGVSEWFVRIAGTALCGVFFSALGLWAALKCTTLNQFLLIGVPIELVFTLPAVILTYDKPLLLLHPGFAALRVIGGAADPLAFLSLLIWAALAILLAAKATRRTFSMLGGERA